ncbi:MAG: type II toxin-antitoxin system VapB family antitoxin [Rhizomicrobium sp.]
MELRATIDVDDELFFRAYDVLQVRNTESILNAALEALVEREAARRLALLGGTQPDLRIPGRRRRQRPQGSSRKESKRP